MIRFLTRPIKAAVIRLVDEQLMARFPTCAPLLEQNEHWLSNHAARIADEIPESYRGDRIFVVQALGRAALALELLRQDRSSRSILEEYDAFLAHLARGDAEEERTV